MQTAVFKMYFVQRPYLAVMLVSNFLVHGLLAILLLCESLDIEMVIFGFFSKFRML